MNYFKQYKLYHAIKNINTMPKFKYTLGQHFVLIQPGLKIVVSEPYGNQILYKLTIVSDGTYKHIPKSYKKYGFLSAMVYDLFADRFYIAYNRTTEIQK